MGLPAEIPGHSIRPAHTNSPQLQFIFHLLIFTLTHTCCENNPKPHAHVVQSTLLTGLFLQELNIYGRTYGAVQFYASCFNVHRMRKGRVGSNRHPDKNYGMESQER